MNWTNELKCPRCGSRGVEIRPSPGDEPIPEGGDARCGNCDARYPIRGHVLDLSQPGDRHLLTTAGWSNHLALVPWIYEKVWRPRALTLLAGERFSTERELDLMNNWLPLAANALVIDLGSSTDLYARGLGNRNRSATLVAIDLARGMLQAGHAYAEREGVRNIAHICAPAQHLPFADASVDAIVCGGSLNEFRDLSAVLREAQRVCKPNGEMFAMSLLAANSRLGRLGQLVTRGSGIQFPMFNEFNASVDASGWRRERQEAFGNVLFSLMRPKISQ